MAKPLLYLLAGVSHLGLAAIMPGMSHDVVVSAEALFLPHESDAGAGRFAFAYRVRIANTGKVAVQLLARHWTITDSHGQAREVRGEGVVGEQPVIAPGDTFEYTSASVLATSVGTMHGTYTMQDVGGNQFEVEIPSFTLTIPRVLH